MILKNAVVFCGDGRLRPLDVLVSDGKVAALGERGSFSLEADGLDADGCYITPGLVDIHIHGAVGADFSDADESGNDKVASYLLSCGVTSFLGTTMSLSPDALCDALRVCAAHMDRKRSGRAAMRGIYLEGPFLAAAKCGAQSTVHLRHPDIELMRRFWEASGGRIRIAAVAPELPCAAEWIRSVSAFTTVSLAHTAIDYEGAMSAFSAGARHVTHLFNAMPPFLHREPGIIGAAADSDVSVELICDGVHIHPAMIRAAFRLFSPERICIVSDAMRACGMEDGVYSLGGQDVTVRGGRAALADGTIAGSAASLADGMRFAVRCGVPLEHAFAAATKNPSVAAGIAAQAGVLEVGRDADLVIWDRELRPQSIFLDGMPVDFC